MYNSILEITSIDRPQKTTPSEEPSRLTVCKIDLKNLHSQIVSRARWESTDSPSTRLRTELQADLVRLRRLYSHKIDEIAMKFGVQQAMDAQASVESCVMEPCKASGACSLRQKQNRSI